MTTRCKFICTEVAKTWDNYSKRMLYTGRLRAVTSGSDENKKFFAYTPSGELFVQSINEDVFAPSKEYFIDISEVAVEATTVPAES